MSFSDDFTAPLWSVHACGHQQTALLPWNCLCRCRPGQERNVNCNTYGCSLVLRHSWYHTYIYICIYHIVTKEGDSLRLGGSRLAQHYLLDRSFQALTELSLRSGEKKAGAVGMSRVIACHTKEVLMHSKHTWYSYGIHMVFIWYPMVSNEGERNQDALWNRTGRDSCANAWIIRQDPGELVQPVCHGHSYFNRGCCKELTNSQLFISFGFCTFCTASIITSIDWGNKLRNSLAAF